MAKKYGAENVYDLSLGNPNVPAPEAVKDAIIEKWMNTQKAYEKEDPKTVYYLSMEFLMGRALGNNLINLFSISVAKRNKNIKWFIHNIDLYIVYHNKK